MTVLQRALAGCFGTAYKSGQCMHVTDTPLEAQAELGYTIKKRNGGGEDEDWSQIAATFGSNSWVDLAAQHGAGWAAVDIVARGSPVCYQQTSRLIQVLALLTFTLGLHSLDGRSCASVMVMVMGGVRCVKRVSLQSKSPDRLPVPASTTADLPTSPLTTSSSSQKGVAYISEDGRH